MPRWRHICFRELRRAASSVASALRSWLAESCDVVRRASVSSVHDRGKLEVAQARVSTQLMPGPVHALDCFWARHGAHKRCKRSGLSKMAGCRVRACAVGHLDPGLLLCPAVGGPFAASRILKQGGSALNLKSDERACAEMWCSRPSRAWPGHGLRSFRPSACASWPPTRLSAWSSPALRSCRSKRSFATWRLQAGQSRSQPVTRCHQMSASDLADAGSQGGVPVLTLSAEEAVAADDGQERERARERGRDILAQAILAQA